MGTRVPQTNLLKPHYTDMMKTALAVLLLVAVASAARTKRFIVDESAQAAAEFSSACASSGVSLDLEATAAKLVPYIDSDESQAICYIGCVGSAAYVFGPQTAPFASVLCPPLCKYVLAEAEKAAGK